MFTPRPTGHDDQSNPYAPPQTEYPEQRFRHLGARHKFSVEDIAAWSWSLYKARFTHCLGAFWGVIAINWICQIAIVVVDGGIAALRDQTLSRLSQFASIFVSVVVTVWLTIGQNLAFLKIARGEGVSLEDIFSGGRLILTAILSGIIVVAILAAPMLALEELVVILLEMIVDGPSLAGVLGILAGCAACAMAMVYLFVRLGLFLFVVLDQNSGVFASLATTWRLGRRRVATVFLVYLLWVTIFLAGGLMCCVGWVFTLPFCSLLLAVTYHALADWGSDLAPSRVTP